MLKGQVIAENRKRAFVVVAVFNGEFAMFEVLDRTDIRIGSSVTGNLHAVGYLTLFDADAGERFRGYWHTGRNTLEACMRDVR